MTTTTSSPALKEWATIVAALLAGEQVIDLRKGGLREPKRSEGAGSRRGFDIETTRCWLYPTAEHQRPELLSAAYRRWIDFAPSAPIGQPITLHGWADIVDVATIDDEARLAELDGKSIWTSDYARSRLSWKPRDPLWVLVMRAHRLIEPVTVDWHESYGGCTSWVSLDGLPADPAELPSELALSDTAFEARRKGVRDALGAAAFETTNE